MSSPVFLFDAEDSLDIAVIGYSKGGDLIFVIVRLIHIFNIRFSIFTKKER